MDETIVQDQVLSSDPRTKHANSQTNHWPDAPDLQLDCLISSDSDSDDSSVELVGVASGGIATGSSRFEPLSVNRTSSSRLENELDCKPGPSSATLALVASKCTGSKLALDHNLSTGCESSAVSSKNHIVIDLTHSDDESSQIVNRTRRTSNTQNNNERLSRQSNTHVINDPVSTPTSSSQSSMPSRSSCVQEDLTRPPSHYHHYHHHHRNLNPYSNLPQQQSGLPSCRYSQHIHQQQMQAAHQHDRQNVVLPQAGSSNDNSNSLDPCASFSNCFVGNPSNGVSSAPTAGPCPHNHAYCPVPASHQMIFPNSPSPQQLSAAQISGFAIGPAIGGIIPGHQVVGGHALYTPHHIYGAQPPAHTHTYPGYQLDPRMHPTQQRLWLQHQRMQEVQRQRMYPRHHSMQRLVSISRFHTLPYSIRCRSETRNQRIVRKQWLTSTRHLQRQT